MMSATTPAEPSSGAPTQLSRSLDRLDERYRVAVGLRRVANRVFPTHWSFMLGEIAFYSFLVLLLSGVYLALFFDPSMQTVTYNGRYDNLRGVTMSKAYESTLRLSFDVRGGLFIRQIHHWASHLFIAAMIAHLLRTFFTGAFRRPREANWVIGILLLLTGSFAGFTGYSLPDDLLGTTGLRIASALTLSIPVIGTWTHWALFGGEFPGTEIIPRLYLIHIALLPAILLALTALHLGLAWRRRSPQFPGTTTRTSAGDKRAVQHTENNIVGVRALPTFAARTAAFGMLTTGVLAIMAGIFQINPIWNYGPYNPVHVSSGAAPDWFFLYLDGMTRIFPPWDVHIAGHTIPPTFWAGPAFLPVFYLIAAAYPWLERRLAKDHAHHHLLQRPRDAPVRTALGAMAVSFYAVLTLSGSNDQIAFYFNISLNATIWAGRIGLLILPPIAYYLTYRICLGLQRDDRAVLQHGIATGIIRRLPHGEFIEIHQPLAGTNRNGKPVPLTYQGAPVPKRMNQLDVGGRPPSGSLLTPDPIEETNALERARNAGSRQHGSSSNEGVPTSGTPAR
ncbi:cytochrome bc1 complex cytochrome b subunit [Pseudonocardia sp. CA-142604]|uniref:cytochrome bc1 complex cytochrome b subunit n=1 Tax=Pseudonocardia sp. CA-142604 TaxID=3240024 RepID=UPI003D8FC923